MDEFIDEKQYVNEAEDVIKTLKNPRYVDRFGNEKRCAKF